MLFIARAIEGVGSACINVCGMSLVAHVSDFKQQIKNFVFTVENILALPGRSSALKSNGNYTRISCFRRSLRLSPWRLSLRFC